jgi:hypothetical protein
MIRMNLFIENVQPDCNVILLFCFRKKKDSEKQDKAQKINKQ